jgi:hemerythrin-like domain-containing protein
MNAIEELKTEHEAVRLALQILSKMVVEIEETGKMEKPEHLEQLLEFLTVFVDTCHHGKEEEFLFPALEAVGVSRENGPIGVMLKEHQQGRDHVAGIKRALSKHVDHNLDTVAKLSHHIKAYTDLLDRHIEKENNVLFPLAIQHLPESRLVVLKNGFDQIEAERIGEGKHEAFHEILEMLQAIYIGTA